MTKKQIESLKIYYQIKVETAFKERNTEILTEANKELNTLLNLLFETFVITDYRKIDKIRSEIMKAGIERHEALMAAQ